MLYNAKDEIFASIHPRYGRVAIWNDTLDFIFKPPSMNFEQGEYSLLIKATLDKKKFEENEHHYQVCIFYFLQLFVFILLYRMSEELHIYIFKQACSSLPIFLITMTLYTLLYKEQFIPNGRLNFEKLRNFQSLPKLEYLRNICSCFFLKMNVLFLGAVSKVSMKVRIYFVKINCVILKLQTIL